MKLNAADQIIYEQNLEKAKSAKSATEKAIYRHKLFLKVADELTALQRNSIVLEPKMLENEDEIKIGASKFGGRPDLPPHLEWFFRTNEREPKKDAETPIKKGEVMPLAFLGQINLAEVKKFDADDLLPSSGRLYIFFLDRMFLYYGGIWNSEEDTNPQNLKVVYDDSDVKTLTRHEFPETLPKSRRFKAGKLKISAGIDFPHSDNPQLFKDIFKKTGDAEEARWIYSEKLFNRKAKSYRKNKMFGHVDAQFPYLDQNEHLLLQLVDYPSNFKFSRDGYLCVTISKRDLRERNWDNVYFMES